MAHRYVFGADNAPSWDWGIYRPGLVSGLGRDSFLIEGPGAVGRAWIPGQLPAGVGMAEGGEMAYPDGGMSKEDLLRAYLEKMKALGNLRQAI